MWHLGGGLNYNNTLTVLLHLCMYMKTHVPSMLAKAIETINKQTQQTSSHRKFIKHSHKGLRNIKAATMA